MTFCFDIGGTKIVGARVNERGSLGQQYRMATPVNDRQHFIETLRSSLPPDDSAVGIAIAGVIDPLSGILTCANIPCVNGIDLATELRQAFGRPVHVINDADAFALAESHHGAAQGHGVVLAIILGTGVGGAIVLDGELLAGRQGLVGEWGHAAAASRRCSLPLIDCNCGQVGCVDTLGGARGLERLYHHMHARSLGSHAIVDAWMQGDAAATAVIDAWLDVVAGALAAAVNLLGPSIVPVGGGLAGSEALIDALDRETCRRSLLSQDHGLLYAAPGGSERALVGVAQRVRQDIGEARRMSRAELEVCIDSADNLLTCLLAGVDRIELCSALALGGLTPTPGLMRQAYRHRATVHTDTSLMAMIRPRPGNFCFSAIEVESMCDDIAQARDVGLQGVVLGASTRDGVLDMPVLRRLCRVAEGMDLTLHRVVDLLDDPLLVIDQAIDLGFSRILTSGGAVAVESGLMQLTEMQRYARGRIQIMAGAGLTPQMARLLHAETGICAFHASCRQASDEHDPLPSAFGFGSVGAAVDALRLEQFRQQLEAAMHDLRVTE